MNLLFVLASISMAVAGQLLLKIGATTPVRVPADLLTNLLKAQTLLALVLYATSALLWIVVLSRSQLSFAYPLLGLNYALVVAISAWILHEPVSIHRWIGVAVISIGFLVTATS